MYLVEIYLMLLETHVISLNNNMRIITVIASELNNKYILLRCTCIPVLEFGFSKVLYAGKVKVKITNFDLYSSFMLHFSLTNNCATSAVST